MDSGLWGLQDSGSFLQGPLWQVDLKLTHLDWSPEATLIHFQGHYPTLCELDYHILNGEIQRVPKVRAAVERGEFCLVEDLSAARWYRGRVQRRKENVVSVFLIDYGNLLNVDAAHVSSCPADLLELPPKLVCGFLANVLLLQSCIHSVMQEYLLHLIGKNIRGHVQGVLAHKMLLLEAPDINEDLVQHGFGRHVDMDTFRLMVEMLTQSDLTRDMKPVPDLVIIKPRKPEFSRDPSSWKRYKDLLSLSGPRLSCGTRVRVRVTAAIKLGLFCCQMVSKQQDLQEMSKKLAELFKHGSKEVGSNSPKNLGLLCAVKGKEGSWCRGFLPFLPVNSQVQVIFVDYGFFETVKVENVHWLPPSFCSLPILAIPCSLSRRDEEEKELPAEQLGCLLAGMLGDVLDLEVNSFDDAQHLYSVTLNEVKGKHKEELKSVQRLPAAPGESVSKSEKASLHMSCLYQESVAVTILRKTMKAEALHVNSVFVGYVEHAQNPNNFWIRTHNRNSEFEEMMSKMKDHFSGMKLDEHVHSNPELGTLCCAMYEEDMHYYRAVVTDVLQHGVKVLFIDFGNTEKVPYTLLKRIPDAFASKVAFSLCCTLANVFAFHDIWSSATCDFFRSLVSNKSLKVRVISNGKYNVAVELSDLESDENIADLLVSSRGEDCFCTKTKVQNQTSNPPTRQFSNSFNPAKETTRQERDSATRDIRRNVEQWGNCKDEERNYQIKAQVLPASFKALSIKPGCEFTVRCSLINSPSVFWCQVSNQGPALQELMDKVQKFYSSHKIALRMSALCCIVKSPGDGKYYRAVISEKCNNVATVLLVDYGCTIQMEKHQLQEILPEFLHLEAQAFRCSLQSLVGPGEDRRDWNQKHCDLFKEFVTSSTGDLRCRVVFQVNVGSEDVYNVVNLYDPQNKQSASDLLVDQLWAQRDKLWPKQQSTTCPEAFVYSSYNLSPGCEEQVYVTHVSSQWEVYCHLHRNVDIINHLLENILYESNRMMQDQNQGAATKLCLAKYLDGKWYRASVEPAPMPRHLNIFYVDYGNTNLSERSAVMYIPLDCEDLLYTPMQALRFCLNSVPRTELHLDPKEWLSMAVSDKLVRAVIRGKNEDGSFDVELFDGEVSINDKMKELVQSVSDAPKTAAAPNTTTTTTTAKTKGKEQQRSNVSLVKSQPKGKWLRPWSFVPNTKPHVANSNGKKKTRVKQRGRRTSQVVLKFQPQKNSEKQELKVLPNPAEPERTKTTESSQCLCVPDRNLTQGCKAECFICHINSVNDFYLHLAEDDSAIVRMGEDLNSSSFRDSLEKVSSVSVGDLVLAVYEGDEALYRSVVKSREGASGFHIEFVDYGNRTVVQKQNLYKLPKEFQLQPRFSISCSLLDTRKYDDDDDGAFSDAVMEKPLMVDFVSRGATSWEVELEVLDEGVNSDMTPEAASPPTEEALSKEEDAPSSSSEMEELVEVADEDSPTEAVPETTCGVEVPPLTASILQEKQLSRNQKSKHSLSQTHSKCEVNFLRLFGPCAGAFIPQDIQAKDKENGTVLSVGGVGCFYVRLKRTSYLLRTVQRSIAANVIKCNTISGEEVREGLRCLVPVKADEWQRAVVRQVDGDTCRVFLVDHGTTREVSRCFIRQQCTVLAKIPDLAVFCRTSQDADQWDKTCRPVIGREVELVFVRYCEAENLWLVQVSTEELFLSPHLQTSDQPNKENVQPAAETQNRHCEGEPASDTSPPHQVVRDPVQTNQLYFGFAAAVSTPSDFCVILDDEFLVLDQKSPTDQNRRVTNLPKVTFPCVLRGVTPVGGDTQWTGKAAIFFQRRLHQRKLHIFFREFVAGTHWKVDVVADGVYVAKELVTARHAEYTDVMLALRFQDQSSSEEECEQDDEGSHGARSVEQVPDVKLLRPQTGQCLML